ncbi:tRNA (adenosine(37)-N6)-dimethylallyltransferase MiaA [Rhizobium sp. CC-YZS058]|uniref:tRNA (adenosine(37)-N6)-dimethylallyltransferase MiaA n=1 Tax=Rhizobium sp. CC-YZS058 TaxID=3042153 RepID=UPI002B06035F|nr:tRNA (adenosine(37)-N6)-dimethylallyltransferase MiaA [Rhizobium sp. CC-YZS058]MEA3534511.1 tRNA (adenosine(37)-N6)-dimethylallyltransferase MiaA [Rhizobium sp. CC-YZS058]
MAITLETGQDAILITGPTASGKSALSLDLAARYGGVVINADSMQVYDTLRILTARPSDREMAGIEHRLYGHVPASETYSTGAWTRDLAPVLDEIRERNRLPIIIGGTGLYFKALTGGLSAMPPVPAALREALRAELAAQGAAALHDALSRDDAEAAARIRPGDGQRILRALEVKRASGRSILAFQAESGPVLVDPDRALKLVVEPERALLRQRIDRRFSTMLEEGAVEEVKRVLALELSPDLPVMKAIGVPQIAAMLAGTMTREQVVKTASAATRQYAKRQMTWFRNQLGPDWIRVDPATCG